MGKRLLHRLDYVRRTDVGHIPKGRLDLHRESIFYLSHSFDDAVDNVGLTRYNKIFTH